MSLLRIFVILPFTLFVLLCSSLQAAEIIRLEYEIYYEDWYDLGRSSGNKKACIYAAQMFHEDVKSRRKASLKTNKLDTVREQIANYACDAGASNQQKLSFSDFKKRFE